MTADRVVLSTPWAAADRFDLTDKVAVITGGAGGIGVVDAQALADAGASVVVADLAGEPTPGAGRDVLRAGPTDGSPGS